jgi:hypothetical protein
LTKAETLAEFTFGINFNFVGRSDREAISPNNP